jgi:hypothetical protein
VARAVEVTKLSTICIPCENGSTNGTEAFLPGLHIPYDYNEVFLND